MSESTRSGAGIPAVEFVPFPESAVPAPLGGVPLGDDPPPPTPWAIPGIILLAVGVAVVVAVAALGGSGARSPSERANESPATIPVSVPDEVLVGAPTETTEPNLSPEVTEAPSTEAPVTVAPSTVATSAVPQPTTTLLSRPPAPTPSSTPVDGEWVEYAAPDEPFMVELPGTPDVTGERVQSDGDVVVRVERIVQVDAGTIGVVSVKRSIGAQDPERFVIEVAQAAANQLRGQLQIGASGAIGSGRFVNFAVQGTRGRLLARAVYADGVLYLITASGDEAGITPTFERVRDSFSLA